MSDRPTDGPLSVEMPPIDVPELLRLGGARVVRDLTDRLVAQLDVSVYDDAAETAIRDALSEAFGMGAAGAAVEVCAHLVQHGIDVRVRPTS